LNRAGLTRVTLVDFEWPDFQAGALRVATCDGSDSGGESQYERRAEPF